MKILIVNNSGNVGKSFLSRELFLPNMKNAKIVEIETHNSSSSAFNIETNKINGNEIQELNKLFFRNDDLIVDLGASQIEKFFNELQQIDMSILDEIDLIVVPAIPNIKEVEDTLVILDELRDLDLGIRIEIILNRCEMLKKFDFFIDEAKARKYKIDTNLQLQDYRAIADLEENKLLTTEILNSDKDYKKEAKEAYKNGDDETGDKLSDLYLLKKQAKAIRRDLDRVFALLIAKS